VGKHNRLQPKPKATDELKGSADQPRRAATRTHQQGGGELYQTFDFLYMAVAANGGHFEHLQ